jgi:adenine deaminase
MPEVAGTILDIVNCRKFDGVVEFGDGIIKKVTEGAQSASRQYILPGFVDAHVHVESSMLVPSEFARLATPHGTVAAVSDPHEIGNVLGIEGVRYMLRNGRAVNFHFYFGAPSCVPATAFETAGAVISAEDIETLFLEEKLNYLSEMMNYPGVLQGEAEVMRKLQIARNLGKPIDGHAPGLRGDQLQRYIEAGISTDHESVALEEALEKLARGMRIIIREGSAARNYEALHTLLQSHPDRVMFGSDDKHPHELVEGHIDALVRRSVVDHDHDLMDVLRAASLNPINHYGLGVGLLRPGDSADFIVVNDLQEWKVVTTYVRGERVAHQGKPLIPRVEAASPNVFCATSKRAGDFAVPATARRIRVIQVEEGQITTHAAITAAKIGNGQIIPDLARDILKLTVVNRYADAPPAVAFIQNIGLREGAIASSIAHDSHNIVAVGYRDEDICAAVNLLIRHRGGIAVCSGQEHHVLPLPVAGIMTHQDGYEVAEKYAEMDRLAKQLGAPLQAPFMTLAFMALLVIPELKLSDKGLFDVTRFSFISLQV